MYRNPSTSLRVLLFTLWLCFAAGLSPAQAPEIDATTPEGAILQRIGMASNEDEKIRDMDEFISKYPDHAGAPWVLAQQITVFEARKEPAKVLAAAERLLAKDAGNVRAAYAGLKAAEAGDDSSKVIHWAEATYAACAKTLSAKMPEDADEENWKAQQDYARQIQPLSEYAFASLASKSNDAKEIDTYADALAKLSPESDYRLPVRERQFLAARAANDKELALKAGEVLAGRGKANEDVLLFLAGAYLESKQNQDKIVEYTDAALKAMESSQKPDAISEEDWDKKLKFNRGLAHWIQGLYYGNTKQWAQTNRSLRTALPLIQGNASMQAAAYFFLGIANFEIGKRSKDHKEVIDAVKFSEQCAAIPSPYQAQAKQNVTAMRSQFRF